MATYGPVIDQSQHAKSVSHINKTIYKYSSGIKKRKKNPQISGLCCLTDVW